MLNKEKPKTQTQLEEIIACGYKPSTIARIIQVHRQSLEGWIKGSRPNDPNVILAISKLHERVVPK